MDLAVGYVHGELVHAKWAYSLAHATRRLPLEIVQTECSPRIDNGRNQVVANFLTLGREWLLFTDTDMVFTPDDIESLYLQADRLVRPIISAVCVNAQGEPVAGVRDGDWYRILSREEANTPRWVDAVGAGFFICHREVYETVGRAYKDTARPWFAFTEMSGRVIGEDWEFCRRAREAGFPIWLSAVHVGHRKSETKYAREAL